MIRSDNFNKGWVSLERQYIEYNSDDEYNFRHEIDETYFSTDFHCHDFYEVYVSVSGGKHFIINDKIYDINPKDMFLCNNYEIHKTTAQEDALYERYVLEFKPEFVLSFCMRDTNLLNFFQKRSEVLLNKFELTVAQYDKLISMFQRYEAVKDGDFAAEVLHKIYFIEMLVFIADIVRSYAPEKESVSYEFENVITPLLEYISNNLAENLSLDHLAQQINLSKHHMCKLFKKCTGTTINKFIVTKRIARAKELFACGHTASEVYETVGFNDYCHFIRTFTRIVGTSPSKYAKQASAHAAHEK